RELLDDNSGHKSFLHFEVTTKGTLASETGPYSDEDDADSDDVGPVPDPESDLGAKTVLSVLLADLPLGAAGPPRFLRQLDRPLEPFEPQLPAGVPGNPSYNCNPTDLTAGNLNLADWNPPKLTIGDGGDLKLPVLGTASQG